MSNIRVTLKSKSGKDLEGSKVSLGDNHCKFPFIYKGKTHNKCIKKGNEHICATELNKKGELIKYANCIMEKEREISDAPKKQSVKKKKLVKKSAKVSAIPEALDTKDYRVPEYERIVPENFELSNRKGFLNWMDDTFKDYKAVADEKTKKSEVFNFFTHQKLVRDYLQYQSPFRGLLLYHGLGVGKTCASIAIAEGFRGNRNIVILLNKSLKQNFRDNLMKCGYHYFRINQHWFFKKAESGDFKDYASYLKIPSKSIKKNEGAWFVDFSKKSNYDTLTQNQQISLNFQINAMIDENYSFIHLDGLNKTALEKLKEKRALDRSVLIIDEVHNLTNAMAKAKPGVRARELRQLIMEATDLRLVFLSGTPMINNPYEVGQLFNLLRGPIDTFAIKLRPGNKASSFAKLEKAIKDHRLVNQFFAKQKDNLITVTKNPNGFINDPNGIVKHDDGFVPNDLFLDELRRTIMELGYNSTISEKKYTAFPQNQDEFYQLFMNENNEMKNTELFKSRLLGMISYYKTGDKSLLPDLRRNEVVVVPMSDYQFMNYATVRKAEIEMDKSSKQKGKSKKNKGDDEIFEIKSSYRAYSRIHCSFVFPEDIPRPYPGDIGDDEELIEDIDEGLYSSQKDEFEDLEEKDYKSVVDKVKAYDKAKRMALTKLNKNRDKYLTMDAEGQLMKYSPKYNLILNRLEETPGLAFVYTEYKTLEGIAVLKIVLQANGYEELTLKKDSDGDYIINVDVDNPEEKTKKRFAFWGGNIDESDIIRKIYNNQINEIPTKIKAQLDKLKHNNLHGDIVKVLLTTKTGAEGIDLHNVRQVHIIEPYWNPVRLMQVKGRAIRMGSHLGLPEDERNVDIFTYITTITPEQKKADRTIGDDLNGKSSDEVLFDISQRKLAIMNSILRMIKESSIDCSLNAAHTFDPDNPFMCMDYGPNARLTRDNYSYIPNIMEEHKDRDRARRVKVTSWQPIFVRIRGKEYAIRMGTPQIIYDALAVRSGRPGEPIGQIDLESDGKKKVIIYETPKKATLTKKKKKVSKKSAKK